MSHDPVVIVAAKRTPMGSFQGGLSSLTATDLGGHAIKAALQYAQLNSVDEVIMGCVLGAGLGQAPARQAAIKAGLSNATPCALVNKVCGSGMKAIMMGVDAILAGSSDVVVAGGMESMTNAPYLLPKARGGYRLGHGQVLDHMFFDGLEDAYQKGCLMGTFAENTADKYDFTREDQDDFAESSTRKALEAIQTGAMGDEIVGITTKAGEVTQDEAPFKVKIEKIPTLKPAFREGGTVTAANSSSISDGAAAVVLMRESAAKAQGLTPLARILGHKTHAHEPEWFTTAPVGAITKLLDHVGWMKDQVDLFEINEAFAVVTMAAIQDLKLDPQKVNVWGGACGLGHPIGASGARLVVTLIHALKHKGLKRGIASLCIGGGEATALALEVM